MRCFGQSPKTCWRLESLLLREGRDTRVLGDPMDLIRCQNYLALPTVTNSKRSVRQDGETKVIREKKELDPFSPLKSLDCYWLIILYFNNSFII